MRGLTSSQVTVAREKYGDNTIPEAEPTTFKEALKEALGDPMIKILIVVACIMFGMFLFGYADWYEPVGTVLAIAIASLVAAKNEVASDTKFRDVKASVKEEMIKVYRDGELTEIPISKVVVGDAVVLQSGDKIPADGTLVEGRLKVDNSALNGESEECKKEADEDAKLGEVTGDTFVNKSSLFRGAVVTDGEGVLRVERVGTQTMMGKMAEEMQNDEPDSPLKVKLNDLANKISVFGYVGAIVIAVAMIIVAIGRAGGVSPFLALGVTEIVKQLMSAISTAVVIIVCAVPEGLPLMISLVLMQNTSKMLDHNVLVRKAVGIETAGSLNILFSDKTGTITKGKLEVVEFFTGDGETTELAQVKGDDLYYAIAKNTQAMFDKDGQVVGGNFTDKALLQFLGKDCFERVANDGRTVEESQSFNSANKFSQAKVNGRVYYKGAPERLLEKATKFQLADGTVKELDRAKLDAKIDSLAERSMRVLAFGYSESEFTENEINDDIVVTGLVGIRDEVRPDAMEAIQKIKGAGIQLVMITGDRLETARAIAKDAGLLDEDDLVLSSAELNTMSDDEVKEVIPKLRVIARALPTDKSRMVRLCQEMNLVVGMTGDGVNDAPALKQADVGFAMGSGTDVAKEAAKIIILDDSLTSIADAILYGRTIYHNILKFCNFQLMINVCAVFMSAVSPFVGIDEPLKVTHLLFVNLVMDSLGAIMLGNEPALMKYMKEKPRRRDESIVGKSMAIRIVWEATWMIVMSLAYFKIPEVRGLFETDEQFKTGYFVMFIVTALFNGFNVRDKGFGIFKGLNENPGFMKVVLGVAAIQAVLVYAGAIPGLAFLGKMFSCVPISPMNYLAVIAFSTSIIVIDLIRKVVLPEAKLAEN